MLTARSTANNGLDLIRLALEILHRGNPVPQSLQNHFDTVVAQARNLAENPAYPSANLRTEVVRLAVEMRQHQEVMERLQHVTRMDQMNAVEAGELLSRLERQPVSA